MPEVSELTSDCGHHCGVSQVGRAKRVGHCPCSECHSRGLQYFVVVNTANRLGAFILDTDPHTFNGATIIGERWVEAYPDDIVMIVESELYYREMPKSIKCDPQEL